MHEEATVLTTVEFEKLELKPASSSSSVCLTCKGTVLTIGEGDDVFEEKCFSAKCKSKPKYNNKNGKINVKKSSKR